MLNILLAGIINNAWPAAALALGLSTVFAAVLLIASIKLKVQEDPKVEQIHKALPNIDCGACGFAGCAAYAKAVAANPELLGKCAPGGSDTANAVAAILNLQLSGSGAPRRPIIHCRACQQDKTYFAKYEGIIGCTSANAQPNVQACAFGCLGFGGCVRRCKFDALHIIDGLAVVDYEKCTGCGACAAGCPRGLIEMVPFTHPIMMTVACSSRENGKNTRAFCKVGCIGCGLCAKQSDLFAVSDNLARIDYARYAPSEAAQAAMDKCPTGAIVYRGTNAPVPRQAG
ncbi:MAG TPA: RnfABCDGE type electron transport complex subunit B [Anaerohalosphaeraceae bacterium]|nr:RnfABCDGE type electron transport complex subunit B [Anaerohalosphaeraceae bacterium]HOL32501.1 RnfABCDGE type electron transport complex subunit B [Anaerohalosphaeraceae bacterium]HOM75641.1 RnfABCDGE type electron transport complex subunit B [Anaerohalosphaeraceae bacterium]HPC63081.1 RnfABCDGE type electron transport complex subunit B [Anaerohalosphaeraceae bacterium]HRS70609.1 RnfABCDGE type electron transport complex subunit B [Anaerohalosphaeraceae bacterium]